MLLISEWALTCSNTQPQALLDIRDLESQPINGNAGGNLVNSSSHNQFNDVDFDFE
jgi:hypothetical protein